MGTPIHRRNFVIGGAATAAALGTGVMAAKVERSQTAATGDFSRAYTELRGHLAAQVAKAKRKLGNGATLLLPAVSSIYVGFWPDDCFYPFIADPSLADKEELEKTVGFLTESVVDLPCVPDRVEPDGMPVMKPGPAGEPGYGAKMPAHLPAAWTRAFDTLHGFGVPIPRKEQWAQLIRRSFEQVAFSCGLVYIDPQSPSVGYGFHDPCAITGFELMSSLIVRRGLQRAAKLFQDSIDDGTIRRWKSLASGIEANLHRLYDAKLGGFLAGSKDCRQFNVWANGLAYWLADDEAKRRIVAFYREHREALFRLGCTRQIAEPGGWQRHINRRDVGSYTNGGFWATGTGYVLPAIAQQDPGFAKELIGELVENLLKLDYCEWITSAGQANGARGFLASIAVPMIALRSIIEGKPLIEYF